MRQASAFVSNISEVEQHAVAQLVLEREGPVLVSRLFQTVCRISHGSSAVREGRVNKRRQRNFGSGKSVIKFESWLDAIGHVRRRWVGLISNNGLTTLAESDPSVIDAVAPRTTVRSVNLYANPKRGPKASTGMSSKVLLPVRPGPVPAYRRAPGAHLPPGSE